MARFPFLVVLEVVLASDGEGTLSHNVPAGESLEVHGWIQSSTGGYNITDIRTLGNRRNTNASQSTEIPDTHILGAGDANNGIGSLAEPLVVEGNDTLEIALEDTSSSSNTVTWTLNCVRVTGN